MDTSETYIKMCEKATEIQKAHPRFSITPMTWVEEKDPYIYCPECDEVRGRPFCPECGSKTEHTPQGTQILHYLHANSFHRGIWLPHQDELQEMVEMGRAQILEKVLSFLKESWIVTTNWAAFTFEQLWLAFVMKKKYGKSWNGEDWVNDP